MNILEGTDGCLEGCFKVSTDGMAAYLEFVGRMCKLPLQSIEVTWNYRWRDENIFWIMILFK